MKALKGFVIFMGLLIVGGVTLVGYGLVTRVASDKDAGVLEAGVQEGGGEANDSFGEVTVTLPVGCVIAEANSEDDRLILRGDGPAERGCQQVLVIDIISGKVLGRVKATPGL